MGKFKVCRFERCKFKLCRFKLGKLARCRRLNSNRRTS
ncbi:hypothetical protein AK914_11045 [Listeria monocytogenes]|uniref:Pentapeptide repeat-containing protein n=1 Tax=Listeria monocytogenes TaxID=1639 RepID=A0AAN2WGD5_LISMN|nr:hypothetical protein [Listeria monocytogenes]EAC5566747.1 hypothetical protein [Listeria monocytogenes]EAC8541120.1 hypothetical protein [Listeria monocytogenes]EAC8547234.1 hypothetical protein [Listeria monocytogenes]EAC8928637.1 hypothetical protein [Listeria monocytogenes]